MPYFDTAGSALYVANLGRTDVAAIASPEAGKRYGLRNLKRGIEDHLQNFTRFLVIAKEGARKTLKRGVLKTSVVFALKSQPGALHRSLSVFANNEIDLLKIESRPIPGMPWKYMFYLDFVTPKDPKVGIQSIRDLGDVAAYAKLLGTYAAAP